MTSQNNFMARVMNVFMNMDEMIGPDFEKGLTKLKEMTEAEYAAVAAELAARTFRGYVIDTIDRPAMIYVGKRAVTKFADMQRFMGSTYGAVGAALEKRRSKCQDHLRLYISARRKRDERGYDASVPC